MSTFHCGFSVYNSTTSLLQLYSFSINLNTAGLMVITLPMTASSLVLTARKQVHQCWMIPVFLPCDL